MASIARQPSVVVKVCQLNDTKRASIARLQSLVVKVCQLYDT